MHATGRRLAAKWCLAGIVSLAGLISGQTCNLLGIPLFGTTVMDIDPDAVGDTDSRGVVNLIYRTSGNRTARYVEITPGPHGGMFGKAIHLYENNVLVYARFQAFQTAIGIGNNHVADGRLPSDSNDEQTEETTDTTTEDRGASEDQRYTQGNITSTVHPNQAPLLVGYHVNVSVDGSFVITIYKDCNSCALFDFPTADARAQSYLPLLQGWIRG